MDENEVDVGFGEVGDSSEQFHRNEVISAVAEDGFLVEEDDDYEDLYNDVNVGEGFLQSLRRNEDLGFRNEQVERKVEPPAQVPPVPPQAVAEIAASIPGVAGNNGDDERILGKDDGGSRVSSVVEGTQNVGFRMNEMVGRGSSGGGSIPPVGVGLRVELGLSSSKVAELGEQFVNSSVSNQGIGQQSSARTGPVTNVASVGNAGSDSLIRQGGGHINGAGGNGLGNGTAPGSGGGGVGIGIGIGIGGGSGSGGGGTILFVGDLHWWTTDAELEGELCKYGPVKEVKFFDEKASGKSKGYCQVEFYNPAAATACKEGMNGHLFNGRPCVVAYASPFSVKRMGEAQVNRNQQLAQATQTKRGSGDTPAKPAGNNISTGGNYQGSNDNNRSYGRGNWGRGNNQGMGGRGPGGPLRNRGGGIGGRGIIGNGGNGFGQGIGATPPLLHPQTMMGQGFDPAFGGHMGQMGRYGGFPGGPTPPFSGILSTFPPVGNVGMPGVAPHVNPAFFNRGMPMNGMGMMPTAGVDGHNMGMWPDPNMAGWAGEEHGGRAGESSYGEEAVSEHQYGEASHDRGAWTNSIKEKERGSERDWSGSSDKRYRDDRDLGYDRDEIPKEKDVGHDNDFCDRRHRDDRDIGRVERERDRERSRDRERDRSRDRDRERNRHRDDKDRYVDHYRYREREPDDEWGRGRSSRTHSKSRFDEERRSRSQDAEYGKRRRLTSE